MRLDTSWLLQLGKDREPHMHVCSLAYMYILVCGREHILTVS